MDLHYVHPRVAAIYDLDNPWDEDLAYYSSLPGETPNSILDLGCGTGTLCCALAREGHRVVGVDPAPAMLAIASAKPGADAVEWVLSKAQEYSSPDRFDWIFMTGHVFQVFLTDEEILEILSTVREHLSPCGRFAFETRNPQVDWARVWSALPTTIHRTSDGVVTERLEVIGRQEDRLRFQCHYQFEDETLTSESVLRFPSRRRVEDLLRRSGLEVQRCHGDWIRSDFEESTSREMTFIATIGNW